MDTLKQLRTLIVLLGLSLVPPIASAVPTTVHWDMVPQAGSVGTGSGTATVDSSLLAPNTSTISDFANLFAWSFTLSGLPTVPSSTTFGLADLFSWILTTDALGNVIDFNFRTFSQNSDGYGLNAIAPAVIDVCTGATGVACSGGTQVGRYDLVNYRVPEPGTLALLGIGLAGLAAARRRKQ